jgi:hypothetical protein
MTRDAAPEPESPQSGEKSFWPFVLAVLAVMLCASRASTVGLEAGKDERHGVVIDQTTAPLPGVTVQLLEAKAVTASTVTAGDGTYTLPACPPEGRVAAALPGFDSVSVPCAEAARIVLPLAGAKETMDVTATAADADSPTLGVIATHLSETTLQRLPTATPHAREALPLLPSVVRGPDGLLRVDGVRPHESPLLLDGFNVTDPATGLSSIDPSVESVQSVEVLRDPMAVTFGGALGSLATIETRTGGETFAGGIQGFIPRPRLTGGGFGRLEGFSPRGYVGGRVGAVHYFAAGEFDFDRIPVPGVTTRSGTPDTQQVGGTVFVRADTQLSNANTLRVEGLIFPMNKARYGLSPLRSVSAAPTVLDRDQFVGIVDRHVFGSGGIVTVRLGVLSHRTELRPDGQGNAQITPSGWTGTSFSSMQRTSTRIEGSVSWQKSVPTLAGLHNLTVQADLERGRLRGRVSERPVDVLDDSGHIVREIRFGPAAPVGARDRALGLAVRDTWRTSEKVQIDGGLRADWSALGGLVPSARVGFRYDFDTDAKTVVKGGVGTFVGTLPLSVPAFAGFPARFDQATLQPLVSGLALPRTLAVNVRFERRIAPGWDAELGVASRQASHLATLDVRREQGSLLVTSAGRSTYREAEAAIRHTWGGSGQLFLSYTRSSSHGEINDFASLFALGDVEILQPGAQARTAADAPHRVLAWGTFDLPAGFGLSPALEWHSGFPYAVIDVTRAYVGPPNGAAFPAFFSVDLVADKALTILRKRVKLQVQLFNVTNHFNPRDVFAVAGSPRFGTFANSVGPTVRGDIAVNW